MHFPATVSSSSAMGTWVGILAPYFQVAKYKYEHGHKTSEQSLRDAASGILRT